MIWLYGRLFERLANTIDKYCPECKVKLKRYDTVKRIMRGKNHSKKFIYVGRYKCPECKAIRRDLPEYLYPFKHYESDIIDGVIEGFIGPETLGFEDYPCEETMKRWRKQDIKPRL